MKLRIWLRRWATWLVLGVAALAAMGLGLWYYLDNYISINDTVYSRGVQSLDLRGVEAPELDRLAQLPALEFLDVRDTEISVSDYDMLRESLPNCQILWSLPLRDRFFDSDSRSVDISSLTVEDVPLFSYLPELTTVNAAQCRDYDALLKLQEAYPELEVIYQVMVEGQAYSRQTTDLSLDTVDPKELAALLPHFPELTSVTLTGEQADDDALFALMKEYPQVTFSWNLDICGVSVNSLTEEVDISGAQVEDLAALEASVLRLPNLKKVIMCGCGISNEEMDALNRRHADIQFVWSITIRGVTLRTDITYLMPYQYNLWPNTAQAQDFRYLTELECLDLGHHNISNCDFVAYMPKLKYLLLGDTRISDLTPLEGLTELIYLEIFLTDVKDYTPLLKLKKLQDLNLCYTMGDPEVVAQLTWVKYIRWITAEWGVHTKADKEMIQKALPDTLVEFGIGLSSTGGQWRKTQNYFDMRDILGMKYMTG